MVACGDSDSIVEWEMAGVDGLERGIGVGECGNP